MAQQQFHTVLDSMSYEDVYEYFGGGLPAASKTLAVQRHALSEQILMVQPARRQCL